jgi:hypothetical protein
MEAAMKIGIGAAVITAGTIVREHGRKATAAQIEHRYDEVFAHGVTLYGAQLRAARESFAKLEKIVAASAAKR